MCSSVQGKATMRNDILKGILRRAIHRAGVASTLEPTLRKLPGCEAARLRGWGLWCFGGDRGGRPGGPWRHPAGTGVWHVGRGCVHHASLRGGKPGGSSNDGWGSRGVKGLGEEADVRPARPEWVPLHPVLGRDRRPPGQAGHQLSRTAWLGGEGGRAQG
jgi:hypothetical protein